MSLADALLIDKFVIPISDSDSYCPAKELDKHKTKQKETRNIIASEFAGFR